MKNFLIIVLAAGLAGSAYLTRPDREEFERYVRTKEERKSPNPIARLFGAKAISTDDLEFKDCVLWTVVKKDGKTLYTGVFDRWIENDQVRGMLRSKQPTDSAEARVH